jgi:predicted ATPase
MLTKLRLERFKNFKQADLALGPLTLLVGANASGKSNLRDAFRFLHGIGRGYALAEIIGEKWGEGGVLQWRGVRGGVREATFQQAATFVLAASFTIDDQGEERDATYHIEVDPAQNGKAPSVITERLRVAGRRDFIFEASPNILNRDLSSVKFLYVRKTGISSRDISLPNQQPILSQLAEKSLAAQVVVKLTRATMDILSDMRFLDLNPEAMRLPSFPGQIILGDRGENLSAVLQSICEDPLSKQALVQWLQELTPMDAAGFKFVPDQIGRVLMTLIESDGQETTAYSASDGTLRFLGMLAALLGSESSHFYFLEELENGIHPTRLHLLLQLIERQVSRANIQIVATTHSPQLLRLASPATLENAALTYRLESHADAQIKRILDIPEARRIIEQHDIAKLYESGWLENSVAFLENEEVAA